MSPQKRTPKEWWEPKNWADEQALRVAKEVRRLRGKRSAQWLADRTAELGHGISRATITDLELGRRRFVTTAEVAILARALNTAPIALLYPGEEEDWIEALPGVESEELWALQWFSGLLSGTSDVRAVSDDQPEYERNLRVLRTARQRWEIGHRKWALLHQLVELKEQLTDQQRSAILDGVADLQRQIDALDASDGR